MPDDITTQPPAPGADAQTLLEMRDVTLRFGGVVALDGVSFEIRQGEILGLIGPNGAGKTTVFNLTTGLLPTTGGTIRFEGRDIAGLKPHQITKYPRTKSPVGPWMWLPPRWRIKAAASSTAGAALGNIIAIIMMAHIRKISAA